MTRKAKRESSAFPDLPLSPVFAAEGVTFQEIFAAFMVSFRSKIQGIAHISFPLSLKAQRTGVCSILPWHLGIDTAKEWGWNACQEKMKVLLLSCSNFQFSLFLFYSFNSWKEKQRQKANTQTKNPKPQHNLPLQVHIQTELCPCRVQQKFSF